MKASITKIEYYSSDILNVYFNLEEAFKYLPGQYVYLTLPSMTIPDLRGDTRALTLSSSPTDNFYRITTKVRQGSGYKKSLAKMDIGSTFEIKGPNGSFCLSEKDEGNHVFLTGGIGITPFRSIIKYVFDKTLNKIHITLLYSAKTKADLIFIDEFNSYSKSTTNIKIVPTLTESPTTDNWNGNVGRIDLNMIQKHTKYDATTVFWICGPGAIVDGMEKLMYKLGIPNTNVNTEKFPGY